ncbi:hypothetical protein [Aureispira sp. CCB-QB1]|uniref:hypothetical protein n=1 Tax=Aureispira sp. CCB-QB1 TaxID=1313421 RepID=UPI00069742B8|nr:hypothetical protein [Aureispira sp. CCB-QB1]
MSKQLDNLKKHRKQTKQEVDRLIQYWTGLTPFDHSNLIYESGLEFLEFMEGDTEGEYFKKLESKRSFWNWWTSKWFSRDVAFLRQKLDEYRHLKADYIQPYYREWHDLEYIKKKSPIEQSYYHFIALQEKI